MAEKEIVQQFVINNLEYGSYEVIIENVEEGVKVTIFPGNIVKLLQGFYSDTEGSFSVSIGEDSRETVVNVDVSNSSEKRITIEYSKTSVTNQNVIARVVSKDPIEILNNNGLSFVSFDGKNTQFTFEYKDSQGNLGTITAMVDWIDKDIPVGTVKYSTVGVTSESVVATLECNEEITITNPSNGDNFIVFNDNGEFTFEYRDKAGNANTTKAKVSWIDKEAPVGTVTYDVTTITGGQVAATVNCSETINHINSNGTHVFTKNGSFTFQFEDNAGNIGEAVAEVTWISSAKPTGKIVYSTNSLTNANVIATLVLDDSLDIILDGKLKDYIFTSNGTHTWRVQNQAGNVAEFTASVSWIDKAPPVGTVSYSPQSNLDVIATLTTTENVTILQPSDGSNTYRFTSDGSFEFKFMDQAGNIGTTIAVVNTIDENKQSSMSPIGFSEVSNPDGTSTLTITFPEIGEAPDTNYWTGSSFGSCSISSNGYVSPSTYPNFVPGAGYAYTIQNINSESIVSSPYVYNGKTYYSSAFSTCYNRYLNLIKTPILVGSQPTYQIKTGRTFVYVISKNTTITAMYRDPDGVFSKEYSFTTTLATTPPETDYCEVDANEIYFRPNFENPLPECPWKNNRYYKMSEIQKILCYETTDSAYDGFAMDNFKRGFRFENYQGVLTEEIKDGGLYAFDYYSKPPNKNTPASMFYVVAKDINGNWMSKESLYKSLKVVTSKSQYMMTDKTNSYYDDYEGMISLAVINENETVDIYIRDSKYNTLLETLTCEPRYNEWDKDLNTMTEKTMNERFQELYSVYVGGGSSVSDGIIDVSTYTKGTDLKIRTEETLFSEDRVAQWAKGILYDLDDITRFEVFRQGSVYSSFIFENYISSYPVRTAPDTTLSYRGEGGEHASEDYFYSSNGASCVTTNYIFFSSPTLTNVDFTNKRIVIQAVEFRDHQGNVMNIPPVVDLYHGSNSAKTLHRLLVDNPICSEVDIMVVDTVGKKYSEFTVQCQPIIGDKMILPPAGYYIEPYMYAYNYSSTYEYLKDTRRPSQVPLIQTKNNLAYIKIYNTNQSKVAGVFRDETSFGESNLRNDVRDLWMYFIADNGSILEYDAILSQVSFEFVVGGTATKGLWNVPYNSSYRMIELSLPTAGDFIDIIIKDKTTGQTLSTTKLERITV